VIYGQEKCIQITMELHDMDREEAADAFSFNVLGAHAGDHSPRFVDEDMEY